jgi:3-oxo-5-alpha-steroid 4-dehydrogenase 1
MSLTALLNSAREHGWLPLLPANYTLLLRLWRYFPLVLPIQLSTSFYPMGKTSFPSLFNLPGKSAWIFQELLSPLFLLLNLYPSSSARPSKENAFLAALFCIHYFHRAIVSPLLNPSMAPMHAIMFFSAVGFNYVNGSLIGAWLGGRGEAREVPVWQLVAGGLMFAGGFLGNIFHEELLRDIRRPGKHAQEAKEKGQEVVEGDGRVYRVPQGGLFRWCWYPHVSSPLSGFFPFCLPALMRNGMRVLGDEGGLWREPG